MTNDAGNSLTPIDPKTGTPGKPVPVADPYNLYFTPDGRYAIVVAERLQRLDFLDPKTMKLDHALYVPCQGVDHLDYTATAGACWRAASSAASLVEVNVVTQKVVQHELALPRARCPRT